ncbi:ABC transporter permease [Cohaesibacter haloalkalitolerans]|uniref:ABC transporter permease n=1 Tax=Cohaesibacter haloalkalitolerans TaxID=1162980 RepID=UPI000E655F54|nr:ABC transporter permease [Cohaesibacter haloalkalitolerans]
MNLAIKDIRYSLGRFLLTAAGVGFLITASIGMVGLYRGIVADALLLIEQIGADLWVVQGGHSGPFSESSAISTDMDRRVAGVVGVAAVRRFTQTSQQVSFNDRSVRATITAIDFPSDTGDWINLTAGRHLRNGHYEVIANDNLSLALGTSITVGRDQYHVVGLTSGMVDMGGDGLMFMSVNDVITIMKRRTNEEILLARKSDLASGLATGNSDSNGGSVDGALDNQKIAAVLVTLSPAADEQAVREALLAWGDVNVMSGQDQKDLLLNQRLLRLRIQILAFTGVLLVVMAIVISLIIYMLTIEKLHQIAMLKLIGARNSVVINMIVQQAFLIGAGGFAFGIGLARLIFPHFPRRVVMDLHDLGLLAMTVAIICAFASLMGISRALNVRAQEVLS